MNTTTTARPATEAQRRFIAKLVADHPGSTAPDLDALDVRAASALIDALKKLPRTVAAAAPVPEGLHILDGTVFKAQRSKAGNLYAKLLVLPEVEGERAVWQYEPGAVRALSAATAATLAQAQAFGLDTGVCACCGATLTNPESIERGIGPVCASRF